MAAPRKTTKKAKPQKLPAKGRDTHKVLLPFTDLEYALLFYLADKEENRRRVHIVRDALLEYVKTRAEEFDLESFLAYARENQTPKVRTERAMAKFQRDLEKFADFIERDVPEMDLEADLEKGTEFDLVEEFDDD